MAQDLNAVVYCDRFIEFTHEAEVPVELLGASGEPVPTELVATYDAYGVRDDAVKEFTVLLRDNRVVTVQGHGLKYLQNPANPNDYGSYAVLGPGEGGEVVVALFRVSEVTGIFNGTVGHPR
jgi:hypothetical protein